MPTKKEQRERVRAVLEEVGLDPGDRIDWGSPQSEQPEVVVARVGDRTYLAPEVCSIFTSRGREWEMSAELKIVDGRPHFRQVTLRQLDKPLSPLDVQRLPWARIAEAAVAANATVEDGGKRRGAWEQERREVRDQRARVRRTEAQARSRADSERPRQRTTVDADKLSEVLRLRAEAKAKGVRWDTYAADRLHYTPAYLRKLAGRAVQEGIE